MRAGDCVDINLAYGYNTPMINRKSTFFLGIFIFVIPFLGIPGSWRTFFIIVSGLALIVLSIKITLPKRNLKSRVRKEKITPVFVESVPVYPKETMMDGIIASSPKVETNVTDNTTDQAI